MTKNNTLHLSSLIISLSLLLLFFGWCNSFGIGHPVSFSHHHTFRSNRKVLATNSDFTPFLHFRQRRRTHGHLPEPSGNEIDLRYGVRKRLVPAGPNPLHH
ncbi:CLAVATA3/ESR (CLE)-related protein 12-like [Hibiscus syriacus]|uniref:CLAVATA3/ESR (CLE)-related protein 12-like n=1 Tax=Hibiscus syriacus TaxID=106335 RepID=UPI001922B56D|nr:CLAVATA3/ESR (CLE)-related protein 12-like [Hibiscus syriacus]